MEKRELSDVKIDIIKYREKVVKEHKELLGNVTVNSANKLLEHIREFKDIMALQGWISDVDLLWYENELAWCIKFIGEMARIRNITDNN